MSIKAIVFDLDGTLLTSDFSIRDENINKIKECLLKGLKVFIATGRMFVSAVKYAKLLGLDTPIICYNGAMIKKRDGILFHKGLSLDVVKYFLENFDVYKTLFFFDDKLYVKNREYKGVLEYIDRVNVFPNFLIDINFYGIEPTKLIFLESKVNFESTFEKIKKNLDKKAYITHSTHSFIEIMNLNVSKKKALDKVLEIYNISWDEVIAFGDGLNDIEVIKTARNGIAMGNARDLIKKNADIIIEDHNTPAISNILSELVL